MVDTQVMLQQHIALLEMLQIAKDDVAQAKGIYKAFISAVGRYLQAELRRSKGELKALKMWVQDVPIGERQYACGMNGRREVYTISPNDLHVAIANHLQTMERLLR